MKEERMWSVLLLYIKRQKVNYISGEKDDDFSFFHLASSITIYVLWTSLHYISCESKIICSEDIIQELANHSYDKAIFIVHFHELEYDYIILTTLLDTVMRYIIRYNMTERIQCNVDWNPSNFVLKIRYLT